MPVRVKLAGLLSFFLHGMLIVAGQYRLSYDAYNHMFFADHYLRDWWSLWEARWYTGFTVTSYPPLVHQLNAALGRVVGVDAGFALLLWGVLTAFPFAIYAFSRIFTGRKAASYAAMGAAVLPSLYLTAHTFGQLPTLMAALLSLLGAVALSHFLRDGDSLTGALAVFLFATAIAGHHATLMFQPWLAGAVLLLPLLRGNQNRPALLLRFTAFTSITVLASLAVIWPFWEWGRGQVMQTPIDHSSRHNFLLDPFAALMFFLPAYGLLIPLIPGALRLGLRKRFWGLGVPFLFLFLLGLGGTTPLPRLVFGAGWAWLTYDRFAFWASLFLLPFFGLLAAWLRGENKGWRGWRAYGALLPLTALVIGFVPSWVPTQPKPVDMQPIVDFLAQGNRAEYRYLTFGFGDQLALLSRLTDTDTIDGSYHTARTLPELRRSGIGQVDTAFWIPGGMDALDPILQESGAHGVRWGFVNLHFFVPVLQRNGWERIAVLVNGVEVWENPSAVVAPPVEPPAAHPFAVFSWGFFPLLALFTSSILFVRRYWEGSSARVFELFQTFAVGLLPFGLMFWYYRVLFVVEHERIFPIYSNALFFLADGLALAAVLTWLVGRLPASWDGEAIRGRRQLSKTFADPAVWLFALCLLVSLSTTWSLEWRTSLYVSLHMWLSFGLFLVFRHHPGFWRPFALGCCAALALQFTVGIGEFAFQTTALIAPLGLEWPGNLQPSTSGVSVVQLADGQRWLRVYGTLPHPNLLGGFAVGMLAPVLALFLSTKDSQRMRRWALFTLVCAALVLVALTFSRSAWIALAALSMCTLLLWKKPDFGKLIPLTAAGSAIFGALIFSLQPLFFTRLGLLQAQTEHVSSYTRLWLVERTWELIQKQPLLGVGAGSYSLALSKHVPPFYDIEPVHNVPLLIVSELGIGGLVLLAGLLFAVVAKIRSTRSPVASVFSGALVGLLVIGVFDHYLWTLAPGRLFLAAMLGLWAGHVRNHERRR